MESAIPAGSMAVRNIANSSKCGDLSPDHVTSRLTLQSLESKTPKAAAAAPPWLPFHGLSGFDFRTGFEDFAQQPPIQARIWIVIVLCDSRNFHGRGSTSSRVSVETKVPSNGDMDSTRSLCAKRGSGYRGKRMQMQAEPMYSAILPSFLQDVLDLAISTARCCAANAASPLGKLKRQVLPGEVQCRMDTEVERRNDDKLYPATQGGPYQRSVFLVAIHKRPSDSSSHESWIYRHTNTDSVGDETISVFSVHSLPLNANASCSSVSLNNQMMKSTVNIGHSYIVQNHKVAVSTHASTASNDKETLFPIFQRNHTLSQQQITGAAKSIIVIHFTRRWVVLQPPRNIINPKVHDPVVTVLDTFNCKNFTSLRVPGSQQSVWSAQDSLVSWMFARCLLSVPAISLIASAVYEVAGSNARNERLVLGISRDKVARVGSLATTRTPIKKLSPRPQNKVKRVQWAKKYRNWSVEECKNVLWAESKFEVFGELMFLEELKEERGRIATLNSLLSGDKIPTETEWTLKSRFSTHGLPSIELRSLSMGSRVAIESAAGCFATS
ncbi:hypothetical protein WN51_03627 [Melipona quadrifasciata]|uniref:Uncharacterized protein n=1 Tax=Melipona quadrifasciata TaxID=166423 RepID=A0A0M8ZVW0_9HYME|nr:hypothetical protein WN51_03627 [Melipona quadrifasciata]